MVAPQTHHRRLTGLCGVSSPTYHGTHMSSSLNRLQLIGNVGQTPEIKTTTSGARFARFSVATSGEEAF